MQVESKADKAAREVTVMAFYRCQDFTFTRLLGAGCNGAVFTASLAHPSADGHPFPDKTYAIKVRKPRCRHRAIQAAWLTEPRSPSPVCLLAPQRR